MREEILIAMIGTPGIMLTRLQVSKVNLEVYIVVLLGVELHGYN